MENEKLKKARVDFGDERGQFLNDIKNLEEENERSFIENKELKRKIKKLEHILYGKK